MSAVMDIEAKRRMLRMISEYIQSHGYAPSIRNLTKANGWASTNATHEVLGVLVRFGWIERAPGIARAMRVTSSGKRALLGDA